MAKTETLPEIIRHNRKARARFAAVAPIVRARALRKHAAEHSTDLRDVNLDGWRIETFDGWTIGADTDRMGKSPIAFVITNPDGAVVYATEGPAACVFVPPGCAIDSDRSVYDGLSLVCHSVTHDGDDNPRDPGWDAGDLDDIRACHEADDREHDGECDECGENPCECDLDDGPEMEIVADDE